MAEITQERLDAYNVDLKELNKKHLMALASEPVIEKGLTKSRVIVVDATPPEPNEVKKNPDVEDASKTEEKKDAKK